MGYIFIIFSMYDILGDYNVLLDILFIHRITNTTLLSNLCGIP